MHHVQILRQTRLALFEVSVIVIYRCSWYIFLTGKLINITFTFTIIHCHPSLVTSTIIIISCPLGGNDRLTYEALLRAKEKTIIHPIRQTEDEFHSAGDLFANLSDMRRYLLEMELQTPHQQRYWAKSSTHHLLAAGRYWRIFSIPVWRNLIQQRANGLGRAARCSAVEAFDNRFGGRALKCNMHAIYANPIRLQFARRIAQISWWILLRNV